MRLGQSLVVLVECRRRGPGSEAGSLVVLVECRRRVRLGQSLVVLVECRRWGPESEAGCCPSGMQEAGPWE